MGWAAICRYGGVGDNLIASSVLAPLREKYGHVEVITQEPQHVIFENNPNVDKLSVYRANEIAGGDIAAWQRWHMTRAKEYDFFANLSHSLETLRAFLPLQTQFAWPADWRRRFAGRSYVETVAEICGVEPTKCQPGFFPTEAEIARAKETFAEQIGPGRYVGWVLSGTRIDKIHPASGFAVARIIRELGAKVILFGAPGRDYDMAARIQTHVKHQNGSTDGLYSMVDQTLEDQRFPIRRILTQLKQCDLIVSPDTGPAWSVASDEIPKIILLSHASPENITKGWRQTTTIHADPAVVKCWPCHQLHDTLDTCTPDETKQAALCISSLSVEAIVMAAATWLVSPQLAIEVAAGAFTSASLIAALRLAALERVASNAPTPYDQRQHPNAGSPSNGSRRVEKKSRRVQSNGSDRGRDSATEQTA